MPGAIAWLNVSPGVMDKHYNRGQVTALAYLFFKCQTGKKETTHQKLIKF